MPGDHRCGMPCSVPETVVINVRLPRALLERISQAGVAAGRRRGGEIRWALERRYGEGPPAEGAVGVAPLLENLLARVSRLEGIVASKRGEFEEGC